VVTVEGDPCFAFHQTNAFNDGDAVVIDLCAYPDAAIVEGLGLERLRGPGTAGLTSSRLLRNRLPKSGGTAKVEEAFPEGSNCRASTRIGSGAALPQHVGSKHRGSG
jgi:carotenoid cleavage dioxygenase-like enzyme